MIYTQNFPIPFSPLPNPGALVKTPTARFTMLTERLLRLEYDPEGKFEDRPSQVFWYREQPAPEFSIHQQAGVYHISTPYLELRYQEGAAGFTNKSLEITVKENGVGWHPNQAAYENLLGTARTLDNTAGLTSLEAGLLSRDGWAVVDDSLSLVFDSHGWLQPRQAVPGAMDLYFFGHGLDFQAALADFAKVAGPAPVIPRWVLGNWWSRYWSYSADELLDLMKEFQQHKIPLSVCVVDMDWHVTETGNTSSGWTGYTWNTKLFPDPEKFLQALHKMGLRTALNLHPADGVHPHEAGYSEFAHQMGYAGNQNEPIEFDISSPEFTRAYFEVLHHPLEAQGVDFWWIDWQQGNLSKTAGLDPLWWLNHLHYYDLGREDIKRPMIFSRWGGLGNHRYPIGFSGDTAVSWKALAFQPYFTATAANVNYGWWSHDIGGHMGGVEDRELFTRWVQFGVFSPIFRLHSTKNKFHERRPWKYDPEVAEITGKFMRFRHRLIPYLYAMAQRNHYEHTPLVRGMYHLYPDQEEAYHCPDQYLFGSELLVAPYLSSREASTGLARTVVWLPEGTWFDFFTGSLLQGNRWVACNGGLGEVPVFAKAGAIVPLGELDVWGASDPAAARSVKLEAFPLADNRFVLYEDDEAGMPGRVQISQTFEPTAWQVVLEPDENFPGTAEVRSYTFVFKGIQAYSDCAVEKANTRIDAPIHSNPETGAIEVGPIEVDPTDRVTILIRPRDQQWEFIKSWHRMQFDSMLEAFKLDSWVKQNIDQLYDRLVENPKLLKKFVPVLSPAQQQALFELFTGAGAHQVEDRDGRGQRLVFWNNENFAEAQFAFSLLNWNHQPFSIQDELPPFGIFVLNGEKLRYQAGSDIQKIFSSFEAWVEWINGAQPSGNLTNGGVLELTVLGETPSTTYVELGPEEIRCFDSGKNLRIEASIAAIEADWLALVNGWESPRELVLQNRVRLRGNFDLVTQFSRSLSGVIFDSFQQLSWRSKVIYFGGAAETSFQATRPDDLF